MCWPWPGPTEFGEVIMCCGASPEKPLGYGPGPLGVSISESSIMSAGASYSCSKLGVRNKTARFIDR